MKGLAWDNGEVGGPKVAAGCKHWFAAKGCQRVYGAVAEVELSSMALAFSKTSERANGCFGLNGVKGNDFAVKVFNQPVQTGQGLRSKSSDKDDARFKQRY
jgi:hypothetical protein